MHIYAYIYAYIGGGGVPVTLTSMEEAAESWACYCRMQTQGVPAPCSWRCGACPCPLAVLGVLGGYTGFATDVYAPFMRWDYMWLRHK